MARGLLARTTAVSRRASRLATPNRNRARQDNRPASATSQRQRTSRHHRPYRRWTRFPPHKRKDLVGFLLFVQENKGPEVLNAFGALLQDFKHNRLNKAGLVRRVQVLFKDDRHCILNFARFTCPNLLRLTRRGPPAIGGTRLRTIDRTVPEY